MQITRIVFAVLISVLTIIFLTSCGGADTEKSTTTMPEIILSTTAQNTTKAPEETTADSHGSIDTYIVLDDDKTAINGSGAAYSDGTVTITEPGSYSLEGTLSDGKIFVSTKQDDEKVKLYFNGVDITCTDDAPLFIESSPEETVVILTEGSINNLINSADTSCLTDATDTDTAGIYSKDDLQIKGTGVLNIVSRIGTGVLFKEDIEIKSGTLNITAHDDGITGRDGAEVEGGTVNITLTEDSTVAAAE